MNPQSSDEVTSTSLETPPNSVPPKNNPNIAVMALSAFILFALGAVAFLYYQNQQLKSMIASYQTPMPTQTPMATTDPTADWKTYTNEEGQFSFKYPPDFTIKPSILTQSPVSGLTLTKWYESLFLDSTKYDSEANIISQEAIDNYGISLVENFENNNFQAIYLKFSASKVFKILIYPPMAQVGDSTKVFDQILSTFKLLTPVTASPTTKPVACTMEAKICPDGSSVGRTGPNCEFAPCPIP